MGLFKPAWDRGYPEDRISAVNKVSKQKTLEKIAVSCRYADTRKAAVKKLTNKELLISISKSDENWEVRQQAFLILGDEQSALIETIKNDTNAEARRKAVEKVTDEKIIIELAKSKDDIVAYAAILKITDPNVLFDIARHDYPSSYDAACRITDQAHLIELLKSNVRIAVIDKITDISILTDIATKSSSEEERKLAVPALTDQGVLANIALYDKNYSVRKAALEKVYEESFLKKIAKKSKDSSFITEAFLKIPGADKTIVNLYNKINSSEGTKAQRIANVKQLIKMMQKNELAASAFWKLTAEETKEPHTDQTPRHDDDGNKCASFHTDRGGYHTDRGFGMTFPTYPFEE